MQVAHRNLEILWGKVQYKDPRPEKGTLWLIPTQLPVSPLIAFVSGSQCGTVDKMAKQGSEAESLMRSYTRVT